MVAVIANNEPLKKVCKKSGYCDKICGYRIIGDKGNIYHGYDKSVSVYCVCVGNFDRKTYAFITYVKERIGK